MFLSSQSTNVEALGCLAVLYTRHTSFSGGAAGDGSSIELAAKKAAKEGLTLLQVEHARGVFKSVERVLFLCVRVNGYFASYLGRDLRSPCVHHSHLLTAHQRGRTCTRVHAHRHKHAHTHFLGTYWEIHALSALHRVLAVHARNSAHPYFLPGPLITLVHVVVCCCCGVLHATPAQRAFEIDNTNSMVVNHMANFHFHKWNVVHGAGATGPVSVRTEMRSVILEPR